MIPMLAPLALKVGLLDLYKTDILLADKVFERWTTNPSYQSTSENPTEYELYSDRMYSLFPTYVLDDRLRLRPGP